MFYKKFFVSFRWRNWTICTTIPAPDAMCAQGIARQLLKQDVPLARAAEVAVIECFEVPDSSVPLSMFK